jgi:hypothetical protein
MSSEPVAKKSGLGSALSCVWPGRRADGCRDYLCTGFKAVNCIWPHPSRLPREGGVFVVRMGSNMAAIEYRCFMTDRCDM